MAEIKLPGYDAIVGNEIFIGDEAPIEYEGKSAEAVSVARLIRFRTPTKEEVLDFVQRSSYDLVHNPEIQKGYIHRMLEESLNTWILYDIARKGNHFENLKKYLPEEGGKNYLTFSKGIIPKELLETFLSVLDEYGTGAYAVLINGSGRDAWGISLNLPEPEKLPKSSELEGFLQEGILPKDILLVQGDSRSHKEMRNHLIDLYDTLNPLDLSDVRDVSKESLETVSSEAIENVALSSESIARDYESEGIVMN